MGLISRASRSIRHAYNLTRLGMATDQRAISPAGWAKLASDGFWECPDHLKFLNEVLTAMARSRAVGRSSNTIVSMPPRHGKSMFVSQYFPGWWLGMFPDDQVMLTAYEADFAAEWGRKAMNAFERHAPSIFQDPSGRPIRLDPNVAAASTWGVQGHQGVMRTAGAGGALLGKGAHLLVIDDPIKNHEDASSENAREKLWNWWTSTVRSRREPGCATLLIMQRWHEDDLAGRFLAGMADGGDRWDLIEFKGLAEADDPLGRPEGEALWPARFPREELELTRRVDPYWFAAQYQQTPRPKGGEFFKRQWFKDRVVASVPQGSTFVRWWDKAASQGKGDWTVGTLMAKSPEGNFYVVNVKRERLSPHGRDRMILDLAHADRQVHGCTAVWQDEDPGAAGKSDKEAFVRLLAGFSVGVQTIAGKGDKETRARPFASQCEGGNVFLVDGPWVKAWLDELEAFPKGKHDDQVDSVAAAFNHLAGTYEARWVTSPLDGYAGLQSRPPLRITG